MTYRTWTHLLAGLLVSLSALTGLGCRTNGQWLESADKAARTKIANAQDQALGTTMPLEIVSPEDTLRRRLMEAQGLPYSTPAALGTDQVPRIKQWPKEQPVAQQQTPAVEVDTPLDGPVVLSLTDALQVGARNSREYQANKEEVFRTALDLELEEDIFRNTFTGAIQDLATLDTTQDPDESGHVAGADVGWSRRLKTGASLATRLSLDLAQLLNPRNESSLGVLGDASVTVPLLRGAGEFVVTEPLTQAQRNMLYAVWDFERFREGYAVDVASNYLGVLQEIDSVFNARENYRQLIIATRRAQRLALAGRVPQFQVEQARQDELRARERWVLATERAKRRLDEFKVLLGLPTDAWIELDHSELGPRLAGAEVSRIEALIPAVAASQPATAPATDAAIATAPAEGRAIVTTPGEGGPAGSESAEDAPAGSESATTTRPSGGYSAADEIDVNLAAGPDIDDNFPPASAPVELLPADMEHAGPMELPEEEAILLAFDNRLDLRVAQARVDDAQRKVAVAANNLLPELTLTADASLGERRSLGQAGSNNASLDIDEGFYSAGARLDLPWERTDEAVAYRNSFINFEAAVRALQELEDQIKLQLRNALRSLLQARESLAIQRQALQLAERRVDNTTLLLEAGRAQIRDVLEAQEALINAQNAWTAALVNYRISELEIQRDMGVLQIDAQGIWREYDHSNAAQ